MERSTANTTYRICLFIVRKNYRDSKHAQSVRTRRQSRETVYIPRRFAESTYYWCTDVVSHERARNWQPFDYYTAFYTIWFTVIGEQCISSKPWKHHNARVFPNDNNCKLAINSRLCAKFTRRDAIIHVRVCIGHATRQRSEGRVYR